ncbi:protein phosphatase regulator, partial [Coemansia biformis]
MDCHRALVDVLLLADCNLYERYPELVQRVDYFLYDWCDETLARTECLLRRQFRSQRAAEAAGGASGDDESFTHKRSVNIVWRQWAVNRLQLPQYPPERINWNKDADPVFLYGQVPALRLEVPWSTHSTTPSPPGGTQRPAGLQLKPALKRTDLQTYLTSPTLSPASSPLQSPTLSLRENMSTSSFGSDATLESENALKPRLRFNDHVEQCMVVFDQEKEYLPTDDDGGGGGSDNDGAAAAAGKKRMALKRPGRRPRRSLVIKLAPTHLKGDHRKLVAVSTTAGSAYAAAGYDSDEEALFGAYDDSFAMFGNLPPSDSPPSGRAGAGVGVGGYVQGYVKSVAGQVRKLVGDAVMGSSSSTSSYASDSRTSAPLSPPTAIVSDPFAAHHRQSAGDAQSPAATDARSRAMGARGSSMDIDCVDSARMVPAPLDVVRDPYSSASDSKSSPSDCVPFDDDEDAIIHEFEREMQRCTASTQSSYYSLQ